MGTQEFITQLNKAQDLMSQEKYKEAIVLLEELKETDKETDLNYNLTHRMYQLYSNCQSLYNQKIILIGDSGTGKTAIKVRFTNDYFKKDLKTTLGVDFGSKIMQCEYLSDDVLFSGTYKFIVNMNIWCI